MSDDAEEIKSLRSLVEEHEAMEELAWRFCAADAAIGIRAQNMGDVKGSAVFDEEASHKRHLQLREERHRWAVNRLRAVDATLWAIGPDARAALTLAFTPGGRVESKIATHFEVAFGLHRASVLGFALRSRAMRLAWAQHHKDITMPDQDQLLRLVEKAHPSVLKSIMRGAMNELRPHLAEYLEARAVRLSLERRERERLERQKEARCREAVRASHERIWGKA